MNVSLTPELEAFVERAVKSGRYGSASEAVREGLRLLSREAAVVAASQEIRDFYEGAQAPVPEGVRPATEDELAAADEIEW